LNINRLNDEFMDELNDEFNDSMRLTQFELL